MSNLTALQSILKDYDQEQKKRKNEALGDTIVPATNEWLNWLDRCLTPMRNIQVFFKDFFNLSLSGGVMGIITMSFFLLLALFGFSDNLTALEDRLREERGDDYIKKALFEKWSKLNLAKSQIQNANGELVGGDLEEKFNQKLIEFTNRYSSDPQNSQNNKVKESNSPFKQFKKIVGFVWLPITTYAFFYWILWMSLALLKISLAPSLSFILPMIVPLIIILIKLSIMVYQRYNKNEATPTKTTPQQLQAFKALAQQLVLKEQEAEQKQRSLAAQSSTPPTQTRQPLLVFFSSIGEAFRAYYSSIARWLNRAYADFQSLSWIKAIADAAKYLFKNKYFRIIFSSASAFIGIYIALFIAQWPITDFLIQILGLSSVGTSAGLSVMATWITFGIALGLALIVAIATGLEMYEKLNGNKASSESGNEKTTIADLEKKETEHASLKEAYEEKNNTTLPAVYNTPETSLGGMLKNGLDGWGSGMLTIRSLVMGGCVVPLLGAPISLKLSFALAMGFGIFWGIFKMIDYWQTNKALREEEQERDTALSSDLFEKQIEHMKTLKKNNPRRDPKDISESDEKSAHP